MTNIEERSDQLDEQAEKTEAYEAQLVKYEELINSYKAEQEELIQKAQQLINQAQDALHAKSVEGLASFFVTQHSEACRKRNTLLWIVGAFAFLIATFGFGFYSLEHWQNATIDIIIGRISLMSLLITGMSFCATQYLKQKHIIEEYAHKKVQAQSLYNFSEEIKKSTSMSTNPNYNTYLIKALDEILRYPRPLMKKEKIATGLELQTLLQNLIDTIKNNP